MEGDFLSQFGQSFSGFYNSPFFYVVKIILGIYIAVLFVNIVLIIILKGLGANIRMMLKGMEMPAMPKGRIKKRWEKIKKRLETENISQYKAAILEADNIADKLIEKIGYKGKNMAERLEQIRPGQLYKLEELKKAHQIRNQIIHEADFKVDKKTAEEIIGIYEGLLKNLELL